ncbi:MAG: DegT/DnrJ/EryC1/StrS family aminotransferase [Deltaproteobacteria bacterium]|nr:DegT/DnrJ/EryC1/StrS family aminotransferase [Deltaproteobacteria bacterium]
MAQENKPARQVALSKPLIGDEEKQAVLKVLDSGMIAQGPVTEAFEKAFAAEVGVPHAVAVANGTAALHVALLAHGIGPGHEVITSSFSFIASGNSIVFTGAKPVFADIDEHSFNLDPASVEAHITPKTRAIMPVHLFGNPCDMDALGALAKKHNLVIIEDACQAHGAAWGGKQVGSFGSGCYSFYPTKNMTSGEGGMITLQDASVAKRARMIRNHGMQERYKHEMIGFNLRMTDLHAAIGITQLRKLKERNEARRRHAKYYSTRLKGVVLPQEHAKAHHVFHQYTIRVAHQRDEAVKKLGAAGVGAGIYYPRPIHQQPFYLEMGFRDSLPITERLAQEVISIPVRPDMTEDDAAYVVDVVNALGA